MTTLLSATVPIKKLSLHTIDTVVFAGGGNRCLWQAGLMTHLLHAGWRLPAQLVGTSAGAGVATALMTNRVDQAVSICKSLYANNARIVDMSQAWRGKLSFAHEHIFPSWVESYLNSSTFQTIRNASVKLRVAFARPHPKLGLNLSTLLGTLAYVVDKHISHSIHPRLPQRLGLKQDFMDLHDCPTVGDAQNLLCAAAAAPPFMSAKMIAGGAAIDGGFVDNAPISTLPEAENSEHKSRTLVLLTRHYPKLPSLFTWQGRNYWQPSRKVPVSTWDCTTKTDIQQAFDLGQRDAQKLSQYALYR